MKGIECMGLGWDGCEGPSVGEGGIGNDLDGLGWVWDV